MAEVTSSVGLAEAGDINGEAAFRERGKAGEGVPEALGVCKELQRDSTLKEGSHGMTKALSNVQYGVESKQFGGKD